MCVNLGETLKSCRQKPLRWYLKVAKKVAQPLCSTYFIKQKVQFNVSQGKIYKGVIQDLTPDSSGSK